MAFWPCSGVYCVTLSASPNPQHRASHMNGIGREVPAPTCFESAGLDQSRREGQKQDSIFGILSAVLCHNHVDCCLADGARPKRGVERGEQLTPMPRETPEMILSRTACCDGTGRDGYSYTEERKSKAQGGRDSKPRPRARVEVRRLETGSPFISELTLKPHVSPLILMTRNLQMLRFWR